MGKFKTPKIEFIFTKGVTSDIYTILTKTKSIKCKANIIESNVLWQADDDHKQEQNGNQEDDEEENQINDGAVNLGPKTMMTLISALANKEIHDEFWQIVENY